MDYSYNELIAAIDKEVAGCADILYKDFDLSIPAPSKGRIYYIESAANQIYQYEVSSDLSDIFELSSLEEIFAALLSGNAVIISPTPPLARKVRSNGYPAHGVGQAEDEKVLRGSNEGFSDSYKTNEALIRKRLRTTDLKIEEYAIGTRSHTGVALLYMQSIAKPSGLTRIKKRLNSFIVDGIMDSGTLEHLIPDSRFSPFPQYLSTERPDRACMALLNGQFVILTDNSPVALVFPVNFFTFFKAADDYYNPWLLVTFSRLLRYAAGILSILLPALYLCVVQGPIWFFDSDFLSLIESSREAIPYPMLLEITLMLLSFELIREAGVRIPGPMGNTIGIVGGLIIGSAAVEASLASPTVVIVVALTALCNFSIPGHELASLLRILKYAFLFLAALWDYVGIGIGLGIMLLHLLTLSNYGYPYLSPIALRHNPHADRPVYANSTNRHRFRFTKSCKSGHQHRK